MRAPIDNLPLRNSAKVEDFTGIELPRFLEEALDLIFSLNNIPGIPIEFEGIPASVKGLLKREKEYLKEAREGLSSEYTIGEHTAKAKDFLFGDQEILKQVLDLLQGRVENDLQHLTQVSRVNTLVREHSSLFEDQVPEADSPLNKLFLESPEQWEISLTNYKNVRQRADADCKEWAKVLTDATEATNQFWPMIAENGLAYNLLFLQKLRPEKKSKLRHLFGPTWNTEWETGSNIFFIHP